MPLISDFVPPKKCCTPEKFLRTSGRPCLLLLRLSFLPIFSPFVRFFYPFSVRSFVPLPSISFCCFVLLTFESSSIDSGAVLSTRKQHLLISLHYFPLFSSSLLPSISPILFFFSFRSPSLHHLIFLLLLLSIPFLHHFQFFQSCLLRSIT